MKGLIDRKELSTTAFERTRMPMVVADASSPDQPIVLANKAFLELTGYAAEEVLGRNCRFLQGPGTSPTAVAEIRTALIEGREANVEIRNYRKNGSPFWNRLYISPIHDDDGNLIYFFASQVDVTEYRKVQTLEASEHRLLMEVDHRAKNVLAIVESIVRLSNADDAALYAASIQHRVQALARVHGLLSERRWQEIPLEDLVRQQVAPFGGRRVILKGPTIMLPPLIVQPLGLVVHELAANAARHGSLAVPQGRIQIQWDRIPDINGFSLRWQETGRPVSSPPLKTGFGTVMIDAMVQTQLKGRTDRRWTADGLDVGIIIPALPRQPIWGTTGTG